MTDRLAEIEQSLTELETSWSEYEFGQSHFEHSLDSIKWLIAEVKSWRSLHAQNAELLQKAITKLADKDAEIERQNTELDDLDSKLGNALRAIAMGHTENERLWSRVQQRTDEANKYALENERLRKIERAARAAVETEKALGPGHVRLTLLADVLEEVDSHRLPPAGN